MRHIIEGVHNAWCALRGSCGAWPIDDLKRDDPTFAKHMNWMQSQEKDARQAVRRRRNIGEDALLHERIKHREKQ